MRAEDHLAKIHSLSNEMIKRLINDKTVIESNELKNAVEYLARAVLDLTKIELEMDQDPQSSLRATLAKVRIAANSLGAVNQK